MYPLHPYPILAFLALLYKFAQLTRFQVFLHAQRYPMKSFPEVSSGLRFVGHLRLPSNPKLRGASALEDLKFLKTWERKRWRSMPHRVLQIRRRTRHSWTWPSPPLRRFPSVLKLCRMLFYVSFNNLWRPRYSAIGRNCSFLQSLLLAPPSMDRCGYFYAMPTAGQP